MTRAADDFATIRNRMEQIAAAEGVARTTECKCKLVLLDSGMFQEDKSACPLHKEGG